MKFIVYVSNIMIPLVVVYIIGSGVLAKKNVYDIFVKGAKEGMSTVAGILPTLVGLMMGISVLRNSGFLNFVEKLMMPVAKLIHFPAELIPMTIIRLFSSSAATGLSLDIYKEYGTDSFLGIAASVMMGCTETVFYTMSIYYMEAKVTKTRWTLSGALISSAVGIAASIVIASFMV